MVKGVHFTRLRDAGDPVEQAARYDAEGADELVFLDISASHEARDITLEMVARVADAIFIPFTVGGGIRSVEDAGRVLRAGADKVAVNTAAVRDPDLGAAAGRFLWTPVRGGGGGCASLVSVPLPHDTGEVFGSGPSWQVFVTGRPRADRPRCGRVDRRLEQLGAGEILLTSMDRDGTRRGYDLEAAARGISGGPDSGDRLRRRGQSGAIWPRPSMPERTGCSRRPSSMTRAGPCRRPEPSCGHAASRCVHDPVLGTVRAESRPADPACASTRPGTTVTGEVKICPGRYRIPDRGERGVLIVIGASTRIDLTGVTLESGDTVASAFTGIGIVSRGVDSVTIRGGRIRGYRYGIRLDGGRGHRISGIDLSGSRAQALRSTPERFDEADWLNIFVPDTFETYGAALYLKHARGAQITGVIARGSQNGIGLFDTRESWVADNDVSGNSGWGIHLWQSARNTIVRNVANHNVRCESASYRRGCDSAALLLRQESDSNLIADNDLSWSGDGFFLSGQRPQLLPSLGNMVIRNDAAHAWHNAFEATFSAWNTFLENRADSADYGFWLGYSRGSVVRGNIILGTRSAGIAIEHGGENELAENTIIGGDIGVHLFAPRVGDETSTDYRVDDNTIAKVRQGIVLEQTTRARLRGNLFDGVEDAVVADSAASGSELSSNVFLSARRWLIDAVSLDAGSNFWGQTDAEAVRRQLRGRVNLLPFRPARDAGY